MTSVCCNEMKSMQKVHMNLHQTFQREMLRAERQRGPNRVTFDELFHAIYVMYQHTLNHHCDAVNNIPYQCVVLAADAVALAYPETAPYVCDQRLVRKVTRRIFQLHADTRHLYKRSPYPWTTASDPSAVTFILCYLITEALYNGIDNSFLDYADIIADGYLHDRLWIQAPITELKQKHSIYNDIIDGYCIADSVTSEQTRGFDINLFEMFSFRRANGNGSRAFLELEQLWTKERDAQYIKLMAKASAIPFWKRMGFVRTGDVLYNRLHPMTTRSKKRKRNDSDDDVNNKEWYDRRCIQVSKRIKKLLPHWFQDKNKSQWIKDASESVYQLQN